MTTGLHNLYTWMQKLSEAKVYFTLASPVRENAILLNVVIPGERWEVEFFEDGTIDVERFRSTGKIEGSQALEELLKQN
ncbi:MAG: hypothetical protein WDO70_07960 [Alphaproteobacteria bacterium]